MMQQKPLTHTGTVVLDTERMILRPMVIGDAEQMFANWASDEEVTKYLTWDAHASVDVTKETLTRWGEEYKSDSYYHWGMELKDGGSLIGALSVVELREAHNYCALGYCMSRAYWSKGYMTEAVKAAIAHLFNAVGVNRIYAHHHTQNPASGRVMQKSGMTFEGVMRQSRFYPRHGYVDIAQYAILREEFDKSILKDDWLKSSK